MGNAVAHQGRRGDELNACITDGVMGVGEEEESWWPSSTYLGDVGHDGPELEDVAVELAAPLALGLQVLGLELRRRLGVPAGLLLLVILVAHAAAAEVEDRVDEVLRLELLATARPLPARHCLLLCCASPPRGAEPQGKEGEFSAALLLLLPQPHSLTHPSPNALLRLRPGLAVAVAYKGGAAEESRGQKARQERKWDGDGPACLVPVPGGGVG